MPTTNDFTIRKPVFAETIGLNDDLPNSDDDGVKPEVEAQEAIRKKLMALWGQARQAHGRNRSDQVTAARFYDGQHFTISEKQTLADRGQTDLTFNELRVSVEWLLGLERRHKVDWSVLPREEADTHLAQVKGDVLKYLHDVNHFSFVRSAAFSDAVKVGIGWIEVGVRADPSDEPIFVRYEHYRNVWADPYATQPDLSDARYIFRAKSLDLDVAISMFPSHKQLLEHEADSFERSAHEFAFETSIYSEPNQTYEMPILDGPASPRRAVRLLEVWYRDPATVQRMAGAFRGVFQPDNPRHQWAVQTGQASLYDATLMVTHVAFLTAGGKLLFNQRSPYAHNRFPLIPVLAYRDDETGLYYGVIKNLIDPQRDLNARRNKALFLLATNKVLVERGSIDESEIPEFEESCAAPDQIVYYKQGANPPQFLNGTELAISHVELANQDSLLIKNISGVTSENLAQDSNAVSGRAIALKQTQGTVSTQTLFDNLRLSTQLVGEVLLSLVEQYYSDSKVIRIIGERKRPQFLRVNQPMADGSLMNDLTASQADFIVAQQDQHASQRETAFNALLQATAQMPPEVSLKLLDLVFEASDLPNKDEVVSRIREVNGTIDPDDPDAAQLAQQQAQQAQQHADEDRQLLMERQLAEIHRTQASTEKLMAELQKIVADAALSQAKAAELMFNPGPQYRVAVPRV